MLSSILSMDSNTNELVLLGEQEAKQRRSAKYFTCKTQSINTFLIDS